jgi:hypothetical protein
MLYATDMNRIWREELLFACLVINVQNWMVAEWVKANKNLIKQRDMQYLVTQRNWAKKVFAPSPEEAFRLAGADKYAPIYCKEINPDPELWGQVNTGLSSKEEEELDNYFLAYKHSVGQKISPADVRRKRELIKISDERIKNTTYIRYPDGTVVAVSDDERSGEG